MRDAVMRMEQAQSVQQQGPETAADSSAEVGCTDVLRTLLPIFAPNQGILGKEKRGIYPSLVLEPVDRLELTTCCLQNSAHL